MDGSVVVRVGRNAVSSYIITHLGEHALVVTCLFLLEDMAVAIASSFVVNGISTGGGDDLSSCVWP